MKLYYAAGTISLMPHVALLESGVRFVAVRVDEASKKMADGGDYNAINPLNLVARHARIANRDAVREVHRIERGADPGMIPRR